MSSRISTVAKKELSTYFSSPIAFIFLGSFLLITLFVFFWVEKFFARNIVDIRPLFEWMPVLLIFLVSALTMRMWSEERRMGTLEFLLTAPVRTYDLVLGKFFSCLALVAIALVLTLGVPITVSIIGDLDWGPVIGAYLASLLLAGAYIAIGLFVSSKSDNQIVSLIVTIVICGFFLMLGSSSFGALFTSHWEELLGLLGTGSRFESIVRGVIDFRDVYYYLSLMGAFLALNTYSLESLKWSSEGRTQTHSYFRSLTFMIVANFLVANFWLHRSHTTRVDLTEGDSYSISEATESILDQLQEPLLIRGYFSSKTHPLLAPLVPQIRDMIREYAAVSGGSVRAEFIDPRENPELEEEAARKFGIKPVPFQIADKYQSSLVNSYFDLVVQYGDKFEVLGFRDLIEVKPLGDQRIDVKLRNLEYDITRSIKKTLYGFQSIDALFQSISEPVKFVGYISAPTTLPEELGGFSEKLNELLVELKEQSKGKFETEIVDPMANGGQIAQEIATNYGFRPIPKSLIDADSFYFYMTVQSKDQVVQISIPQDLSVEGAKRSVEAALKRFSPGFLKTIGISAPKVSPPNPFNPGGDSSRKFNILQEKLQQSHTVEQVDLSKGSVPEIVDLLLVLAPENFGEKEQYAIDQFLMRGGTVIAATSPFSVSRAQTGVAGVSHTSGIEELLTSFGVSFEKKLVLDPQNEPYPVPTRRDLGGGFTVQEMSLRSYPFFVDVRGEGLTEDNGILSGIPQVTLNWSSPLVLEAKEEGDKTRSQVLLSSSDESWVTSSSDVQPNYETFGELGFRQEGLSESRPLAALVEGTFTSFFSDKPSPLGAAKEEIAEGDPQEGEGEAEVETPVFSGNIDRSTDSARLIVFGSNEFLSDQVLQISAAAGTERFLNSIQLVENAIDWSLEDRALLSIRSGGHYSRTIPVMGEARKIFWEYLNYGIAIFGLLMLYLLYRMRRAGSVRTFSKMLEA